MKFSENWLRSLVDLKAPRAELAHRLTMAGLEVEGIEAYDASLAGVVVAEIVGAEKHPQADKLQVCRVNAGGEELQIVCGAPNARVGLKAPLATIGAPPKLAVPMKFVVNRIFPDGSAVTLALTKLPLLPNRRLQTGLPSTEASFARSTFPEPLGAPLPQSPPFRDMSPVSKRSPTESTAREATSASCPP